MPRPTDQELEVSVARMLQIGVTASAVIVLAGGAFYLHQRANTVPDFTHFQAQSLGLSTLSGIYHGALLLRPLSLVQAGLILLIATPVARVALCVVGFARQRDRLYTVISLTVLLILFYALTKGAH
jgi:uncharacterized membrane protein